MVVGLKTQEAVAEFRKAVKHGGSLPCFTRDNLVLMMAEFDRLERLVSAPVSARHNADRERQVEGAVARELISVKGGNHWTGKRRTYNHKYSVQPSVLTPGDYIWVVRTMADRFLGSGQEKSFNAAAEAARKKISALVDEEDAEKYPVPF